MNVNITDQLISITGDGGEVHDINTNLIVRTVIKTEGDTHRIIFIFPDGSHKSFLRSAIGIYSIDGVVASPVPAIGVIRATLQAVVSAAGSVVGNEETPTRVTYAADLTIPAGAKSVTIITNSTFAGTILGDAAWADGIETYAASPGNTLKAIAITRSAGGFTVLRTV